MARLLVINPNSLTAVTAGIDAAVAPLRGISGIDIDVIGIADGPPGIQTQRDVDGAGRLIADCVRRERADAYVVACFSDPGLHAAREITTAPVLGIAESGILAALGLGARFGIIAILATSIPRHLRYVGAMGVLDRFAGDRAIGVGVAGLSDAPATFERMCRAGAQLRDTDGADVLVMGCAGMAQYRAELESTLGIPVVEPTQAAAAAAVGRLLLRW